MDFESNSKKIWNGINRLISQKKVNKSQTINLYENGQFITSQQEVAEKFNSYFTNVGKNLSDNIEYLGQHFSSFMPEPTAKSFFLEPTSPGEILLELKNLSNSTSSDVPINLIKIASIPLSNLIK